MTAQAFAQGAREGQMVYGDTHVFGAATVHLGNVYISNTNSGSGIENRNQEAKEGE